MCVPTGLSTTGNFRVISCKHHASKALASNTILNSATSLILANTVSVIVQIICMHWYMQYIYISVHIMVQVEWFSLVIDILFLFLRVSSQ